MPPFNETLSLMDVANTRIQAHANAKAGLSTVQNLPTTNTNTNTEPLKGKRLINRLGTTGHPIIRQPSREHRIHVARACEQCRGRKTRCSGHRPNRDGKKCTNCILNGTKCEYTDGKRELARQRMKNLKQANREYEAILTQLADDDGKSVKELRTRGLRNWKQVPIDEAESDDSDAEDDKPEDKRRKVCKSTTSVATVTKDNVEVELTALTASLPVPVPAPAPALVHAIADPLPGLLGDAMATSIEGADPELDYGMQPIGINQEPANYTNADTDASGMTSSSMTSSMESQSGFGFLQPQPQLQSSSGTRMYDPATATSVAVEELMRWGHAFPPDFSFQDWLS
ncbi:hypothetical protein BDV06DRAFT_228101 [Aspergillus oleicola]